MDQSRLAANAALEALNRRLLSHPSATVTLEDWCRAYHLASNPLIVARQVAGVEKALTLDQRERLIVGPDEPVRYRRVELTCETRILSIADNWYVPSRLTSEINHILDTTKIPFGRAVAPLHFTRRTLQAQLLWSPLSEEWKMGMRPAYGLALLRPSMEVLRHRAVLSRADGLPFCEVVETYTEAVLDRVVGAE